MRCFSNSERNLNQNRLLRMGSCLSVGAWGLLIWVLSSLSGQELAELDPFNVWDKAAHFLAFATGTTLLTVTLRLGTRWSWPRIALLAALAISIFGATDEWHQLYTPHRSGGDLQDWLADTLGAVTAALLTSFVYARYQRKNCPPPAGD